MKDYLFELDDGEYVFVELYNASDVSTAYEVLEDEGIDTNGAQFLGLYTPEEAEEMGFDTF